VRPRLETAAAIADERGMAVRPTPLRRCATTVIHGAHRLAALLRPEIPELRALRDSGRGRRCFIIGNGPSLARTDLDPLAGEVSFAVNGIFLKFDELDFRPTYYVVEDGLVARDRAGVINGLGGMRKLFPKYLKPWLHPDPYTTYMNVILDYRDYRGFPEFSTNAARALWVGGTVTYINLQLAFYMGFDPVILIGVDCDYEVRADEVEVEENGVELTSTAADRNHFHPDYFGPGFRFHDPMVGRMIRAYEKTRAVFDAHGRRVWNATLGGKLETFERVDYASLF
jgi:hypothetical protein